MTSLALKRYAVMSHGEIISETVAPDQASARRLYIEIMGVTVANRNARMISDVFDMFVRQFGGGAIRVVPVSIDIRSE